VPEYRVDSLSSLSTIPVTGSGSGESQTLGGLGTITRGTTLSVASRYNIQPIVNIFAATQDRDLGAVVADVQQAIAGLESQQPKGVKVTVRGQYETMNTAFSGLAIGLIGAIVLIYLVIVVNFQSWVDPLVIIGALPAALAGIVWMLFVTGTTLSVPALTGAIMCMGVATANAILVVSFARERYDETGDATQSALEAGLVRFRPVLMTALAMIIGMAPMAIGLGEGAEQNAPLGRAVIGGLFFATAATLLFVPALFSFVHRKGPRSSNIQELSPSYV
jgi:multidrug efflux pump subunit AcrB